MGWTKVHRQTPIWPREFLEHWHKTASILLDGWERVAARGEIRPWQVRGAKMWLAVADECQRLHGQRHCTWYTLRALAVAAGE